jgi:hypothetical protein
MPEPWPAQAHLGPDWARTPSTAHSRQLRGGISAPTPQPCALLALQTHPSTPTSTAAAAGRRLAQWEQRAARGPASIVGSTASPAASSDEGKGREEEGGRGQPAAARARVWWSGEGRVGGAPRSFFLCFSSFSDRPWWRVKRKNCRIAQ